MAEKDFAKKESDPIPNTPAAEMPDPSHKTPITEDEVKEAFSGEQEQVPKENLPEAQGDMADQAEGEEETELSDKIRELRKKVPKSA